MRPLSVLQYLTLTTGDEPVSCAIFSSILSNLISSHRNLNVHAIIYLTFFWLYSTLLAACSCLSHRLFLSTPVLLHIYLHRLLPNGGTNYWTKKIWELQETQLEITNRRKLKSRAPILLLLVLQRPHGDLAERRRIKKRKTQKMTGWQIRHSQRRCLYSVLMSYPCVSGVGCRAPHCGLTKQYCWI